MFSLIGDKAFNTSVSKLRQDFYLMKQTMSFQEAQAFCKDYKKYDTHFELFDRTNANQFEGIAYPYLNGKAFKKVRVQIRTSGLGMSSDIFNKYYEGVPIKLGNIISMNALELYPNNDESVGAIIIQVDNIYDKLDWQNYQTLLRLEEDWIQPDEF